MNILQGCDKVVARLSQGCDKVARTPQPCHHLVILYGKVDNLTHPFTVDLINKHQLSS